MSQDPQFSHDASKKAETPPVGFSSGQILSKHDNLDRMVLVMADDDEDDCLLVKEALSQAGTGFVFHCVRDGAEMMDYLNRSGQYEQSASVPVPDIIFLDLNMPKMNGRQVLKKLKTDPRFRAIPVIILTTSRDVDDVQLCYSLGANSFITKQSSFDELVSAMKTIAEYWTEIATLPPRKTHDPMGPDRLS